MTSDRKKYWVNTSTIDIQHFTSDSDSKLITCKVLKIHKWIDMMGFVWVAESFLTMTSDK